MTGSVKYTAAPALLAAGIAWPKWRASAVIVSPMLCTVALSSRPGVSREPSPLPLLPSMLAKCRRAVPRLPSAPISGALPVASYTACMNDEPRGFGAALAQPRTAARASPLAPISASGPWLPPLSNLITSPLRLANGCWPAKARAPSPPTCSPSANSTITSLASGAPPCRMRSVSSSAATGAAEEDAPRLRSLVS